MNHETTTDECTVQFRIRRYAEGARPQLETLGTAPVLLLQTVKLTPDGLRVVGNSNAARYGVQLVTYRELQAITTYGPDMFRRAAAAGYIKKFGTDNRPTFDLAEVLRWLANPRHRATRVELTGEGPRLGRGGRVSFAA